MIEVITVFLLLLVGYLLIFFFFLEGRDLSYSLMNLLSHLASKVLVAGAQ